MILDCLMLMQELALDAVTTVMAEASTGQREIDIKKYVKIEKIPGGAIEDCRWNTLNGHSCLWPDHCAAAFNPVNLRQQMLVWTFQHSLSSRSCGCDDLLSFVAEC